MKYFSRRILWTLSVVALLTAFGSLALCFAKDMNFVPRDLRTRYAELSCSRSGINPFHIWNHDLTSEEYYGYPRPDKSSVPHSPEAKAVHAYPPYHTFFCWWMPNFSLSTVVGGYVLVNLMAFLIVAWFLVRRQPDSNARAWYWLVLSSLAFCFSYCVECGNYGNLILVAMLTILFNTKKFSGGGAILRGLAVAFIMVKPQIGIPMCLFLLIEKRFAELLIGGLSCIVGTAFTAYVYGENTIELILQMTEIGRPYIGVRGHCDGTFLIFYLLRNFVGSWSLLLCGGIVLGLATILTFRMNAREDVFVRALPLVASIPMWTYSQSHDGVVLVVAVIGIFSIIANRMKLKDKCFCLLVFAFAFFVGTWSFLSSGLGVFDPSGLGWIYRVVHFAFFLSIYLFAMSVIFRERNRKYVTSLKERAK